MPRLRHAAPVVRLVARHGFLGVSTVAAFPCSVTPLAVSTRIPLLNEKGVLSKAAWAAREDDGTPAGQGRAVFRAQCSSCHTLDGYLAIRPLVATADEDLIGGILAVLQAQGEAFTRGGGPVATEKLDYPLMPPLVGTEEEVEALRAFLLSLKPSQTAEVARAD